MRTAQSDSSLLQATRNQQSCHKLVIGNWNITSLTGKEHELVAGARDGGGTYHHCNRSLPSWQNSGGGKVAGYDQI